VLLKFISNDNESGIIELSFFKLLLSDIKEYLLINSVS